MPHILDNPGAPLAAAGADFSPNRQPSLPCGPALKPRLGLGVWQVDNRAAHQAVFEAFRIGYRAVDTAAVYNNEIGVGLAVKEAWEQLDLPREEIFITTKLWNDCHTMEAAFNACRTSLQRLGLEYIDLYLIHWPAPNQNRYLEAWKALQRLRDEGLVRAIGVSNFLPEHIDRLLDETGEAPAVNQVELHPHHQQPDLCQAMRLRGVEIEAAMPLGQGQVLSDPLLSKLGLKYSKTKAQVVLRWHLESGRLVIPKSIRPARLRENFDIFDFHLDPEDMRQIALLEAGRRLSPNPATYI